MYQREQKLNQLYWAVRFGLAFIWIWTAIVSWFIYPQAESLMWLRKVGVTYQPVMWLMGACLFDLAMGIASAFFASKRIWQAQLLMVIFYSLVIALELPEFLFHPFGPITKNIAVVGCLFYLLIMEKR